MTADVGEQEQDGSWVVIVDATSWSGELRIWVNVMTFECAARE